MGGLLTFLTGPVLQIINKLIPDPQAQAQAQIQLLQLQQNEQFKELDAAVSMANSQTDIDKAEAANNSLFVAGWRPFIGWICGAGLGWNYVGISIVDTVSKAFGHPVAMPMADLSEMMPILIGMLGLGGMRTYEKLQGVSNGH